ncbi:hypothetical protein FAIPA1_40152 [Frankia sp. AiPs1]
MMASRWLCGEDVLLLAGGFPMTCFPMTKYGPRSASLDDLAYPTFQRVTVSGLLRYAYAFPVGWKR